MCLEGNHVRGIGRLRLASSLTTLRRRSASFGRSSPQPATWSQVGQRRSTPGDVEREPFPAFLHVYVDAADAAFRRAVAAGAQVIEEPVDTPYGDRRAMVRDPFGNVLQIAHPASEG